MNDNQDISLNKKQEFSLAQELLRKSFHILLLLLPLGYYLLGKIEILKIITPIAIFIAAFDYFRHKNDFLNLVFTKTFGVILRQKEQEKGQFCGATFAFVAAVLIFSVAKEEVAIMSFVILAICDLMASLVGKTLSSKPFFEKSFAGSAAFYISGVVILLILGSFFDLGFLFYIFALFALFAVTIVEARPSLFAVDDNFSIPIGFAFILTIFDLMWGII